MTEIEHAARRAAEEIIYDVMENPKPRNVESACKVIAAEFAPVRDLLAEAERLLNIARHWVYVCVEDGWTDAVRDLAAIKEFVAKENGNG